MKSKRQEKILELIEKYDIAITPLSVHCGDKVGRDGVEITPEIIYDYVDASGQLPRTSAVNVFDYVHKFSFNLSVLK